MVSFMVQCRAVLNADACSLSTAQAVLPRGMVSCSMPVGDVDELESSLSANAAVHQTQNMPGMSTCNVCGLSSRSLRDVPQQACNHHKLPIVVCIMLVFSLADPS